MLVDTHAHIYLDRFDADRSEMIKRAHEAGVGIIIMPAIDVHSVEAALQLAEREEGLYVMAALHPSETRDATDVDFDRIVSFCEHPKVVAVGESGLDYYWDRTFDERQHLYFRKHIQLAIEKDLPLILHNREASADLVTILRDERANSKTPEKLRGIFHCFGGPEDLAIQALELGFMLGIGGTLTYKNSGVADAITGIALDRIVLETDAPFLAPVPFRGRRNEPAYVRYVADRLAETRQLDVSEIERITTENALRLFDRIQS